jgi:hypothetical protein
VSLGSGTWVTPRFVHRVDRRARRAAVAAVAMAWLGLVAPARADRIDDLGRTLRGARAEKARISAAMELAKLHAPRTAGALIAALGDRSNIVRAIAAGALGNLGDRRAVAALRKASTDRDATVRRRASAALAALDPRPAPHPTPALAAVKLDARESPRLDSPSLFLVMKSATDRSAGRAAPVARRQREADLRALMVSELEHNRRVTTQQARADALGIEPYQIDVTITKLDRGVSGPFVEVACELRVAVSNRRGKMISLLTGGAKVQLPRHGFRKEHEPAMRSEALENAVKSVHQDLITYLTKRPS